MTRLLLLPLFIGLISACSDRREESTFVCDSRFSGEPRNGLSIKGSVVALSHEEFEVCERKGTTVKFSSKKGCNGDAGEKYAVLDNISGKLTIYRIEKEFDEPENYLHCERVP